MSFTPTQNYTYNSSLIQITGGSASLIVPNLSGTLLFNDIYTVQSFVSVIPTIAAAGTDNIKFVMIVNGSPFWWNGAAWVASNETYAQANLYTDVNTNASGLISGTQTLQILLIFQGSGTTGPSISNLLVSVGLVPSITTPAGQCGIYVYLQDILGADFSTTVQNPQFIAINDTPFFNNGYTVGRFTETASFITDNTGTWAYLNIIQTASSGQKIRFLITYQPNTLSSRLETLHFKPAVVPAQTAIDLSDLTSTDTNQLL